VDPCHTSVFIQSHVYLNVNVEEAAAPKNFSAPSKFKHAGVLDKRHLKKIKNELAQPTTDPSSSETQDNRATHFSNPLYNPSHNPRAPKRASKIAASVQEQTKTNRAFRSWVSSPGASPIN
jgi:hypothetical protein